MQDHDWIFEVFEDLTKYAKKHGLNHLEDQLDVAASMAKHDIFMAKLDPHQHSTNEHIGLGEVIGICKR